MENEDLSNSLSAAAAAPALSAPSAPAFDPRRRIRELLAIPERDRTDAQWDELNELEIQTAPGNRAGSMQPQTHGGKPGYHQKNRMKGKGGKPGPGGRPHPGGKLSPKPRPT